MGVTPPASALAHVALIQNPATPIVPANRSPTSCWLGQCYTAITTQPNPLSVIALPTQPARMQSQIGLGSALPMEANGDSLLTRAGTCPFLEPICKKIQYRRCSPQSHSFSKVAQDTLHVNAYSTVICSPPAYCLHPPFSFLSLP